MLSLSCADPWPEVSVGMKEELLSAAAQVKEWNNDDEVCSSVSEDDSLTSLHWLQDFSIDGANGTQHHPISQELGSQAPAGSADPSSTDMTPTPRKFTVAAYSSMPPLSAIWTRNPSPDKLVYKTNAHIKPPYTYATLIYMAIKASKQNKITLSCIYKWITDNFCYYRYADSPWQNSVRTNLSLNKCFIKVPRQKDEPGKGCFWMIDPRYADHLLGAAYKKTRFPPVQINPELKNKFRANLQPPPRDPCSPTGGLSQRGAFKDAAGTDESWNAHQIESTRTGSSNVTWFSSPPLFPKADQNGDFDWKDLMNSALKGELSFKSGDPSSSIIKEKDLAAWETHISHGEAPVGAADIHTLEKSNAVSYLDEEPSFTSALQSLWPEETEQGCSSFYCNSTVDQDQLFDSGDLGGDPGLWIETFL